MKRLLIVFFLVVGVYSANAQAQYAAEAIPKELLPYASAVIRNQEVNIEVAALDNTIYRVKEAITVLNKNGDEAARVIVYHNKITSIKYIKGQIFNQWGKQVGKFGESDFDDVSVGH